jgi:SPX domain protein involved in polyphosphate accumulation
MAFEVQEEALFDLVRQRDEAIERCQNLSGRALDDESDLVVLLDKEIKRVQTLVKNTSANLNLIRPDENGVQIAG